MAKKQEETVDIAQLIAILGAIFYILKLIGPEHRARVFKFIGILLAGPFVLVTLVATSISKCMDKFKTLIGTERDFWLSEEEQAEFITLVQTASSHKEKLDEADELAAGHRTTQSGRVDARSYDGRRANELRDHYGPAYNDCIERLDELKHRPIKRYKAFLADYRQCFATVAALTFGTICASFWVWQTGLDGNVGSMITMGNVSLAMAWAVFSLLFMLVEPGSELTPEPPVVTIDNLSSPCDDEAIVLRRNEMHMPLVCEIQENCETDSYDKAIEALRGKLNDKDGLKNAAKLLLLNPDEETAVKKIHEDSGVLWGLGVGLVSLGIIISWGILYADTFNWFAWKWFEGIFTNVIFYSGIILNFFLFSLSAYLYKRNWDRVVLCSNDKDELAKKANSLWKLNLSVNAEQDD